MERKQLVKALAARAVGAFLAFVLMFFAPAGTFNYWQAWVYIGITFFAMFLIFAYMLNRDPALLERRMRMREERSEQKTIVKVSYIFFLLVFILPGLDKRFGWSHISTTAVIVADVVFIAGYYGFFLVMKENSYASRVIEIMDGQKVISTGPYAVVRHPMYSCVIVIYLATPLALGSYWTLIPSLLIIPLLMARIKDEEIALEKDLAGYAEYKIKTKYRLLPFVW